MSETFGGLILGMRINAAEALQAAVNGATPTNRNLDVRFRGKKISDLSRDEAIEALHQAIERIKRMGDTSLNSLMSREQYVAYTGNMRKVDE